MGSRQLRASAFKDWTCWILEHNLGQKFIASADGFDFWQYIAALKALQPKVAEYVEEHEYLLHLLEQMPRYCCANQNI